MVSINLVAALVLNKDICSTKEESEMCLTFIVRIVYDVFKTLFELVAM